MACRVGGPCAAPGYPAGCTPASTAARAGLDEARPDPLHRAGRRRAPLPPGHPRARPRRAAPGGVPASGRRRHHARAAGERRVAPAQPREQVIRTGGTGPGPGALPYARPAAVAREVARRLRTAPDQHVGLRSAVGAPARRGGVLGAALRARQAPGARPPIARRRHTAHARTAARAGHRLGSARRPALRAPGGRGHLRDPRAVRRHRVRRRPAGELRDRRGVSRRRFRSHPLLRPRRHQRGYRPSPPARGLAPAVAGGDRAQRRRASPPLPEPLRQRPRGPGARARGEATVSGVAYGFLFGGAVAVVGTLADVSDRHAATLAEAFCRRVLEPVPIGEALRAARAECRRNPESAGSPTWLSFVLYGNPGQTLLRSGAVVPLPLPPAPAPEEPAPAAPPVPEPP